MWRLKKIVVTILVAIMLTISSGYNNSVLATESEKEYLGVSPFASNYISTYFGELVKTGKEISVNYSMIAYCDKSGISIELQVYENGSWSTVKSWENSSTSTIFTGAVNYTGVSGKQYRANIVYMAYYAGKVAEIRTNTLY